MPSKKKPKRPGRKPKLLDFVTVGDKVHRTDELILSYIRQGTWDYVAAEAAGVDPATLRRYLEKGEAAQERFDQAKHLPKEQELYRAFRASFQRAKAEARLLREVKVADDNPLKWLERRYKDEWGPPVLIDARTVNLTLEVIESELESVEAELERRGLGDPQSKEVRALPAASTKAPG